MHTLTHFLPFRHRCTRRLPQPPIQATVRPAGFNRQICIRIVAAISLIPIIAWAADPQASPAPRQIELAKVPEGAKRLTIPLTVSDPDAQGFSNRRYIGMQPNEILQPLDSVPQALSNAYTAGKNFAFEFATLPDGTRFIVLLGKFDSMKNLTRNQFEIWHARIYKFSQGDNSEPELLREGFQTPGGEVTFPLTVPIPDIGTNHVDTAQLEVGYSINGTPNNEPMVYSRRNLALTLSGTQITEEGQLTVTAAVPETFKVSPETSLTLSFHPLEPGLPDHIASGTARDLITLGSARIAVVSMASDFSSVTLAVVAGSLKETFQESVAVGADMPPFSQVDLVNRRTVTREDVLATARTNSGVVFIFGDLAPAGGRYNSRYVPPNVNRDSATLPLPVSEIAGQLAISTDPPPLLVIVTRQIGIDFLYGDLRNKTPDYLLITDYVDPLQTSFQLTQPGSPPFYRPRDSNPQEPSLRQVFDLPDKALPIVAVDNSGKVVYVRVDAQNTFLASLAEARAAIAAKTQR